MPPVRAFLNGDKPDSMDQGSSTSCGQGDAVNLGWSDPALLTEMGPLGVPAAGASAETSSAAASSGGQPGSGVATTQTVSTSGSGLVFVNTYGAGVTAAYESCIVTAEQTLESLWSNSITINVTFEGAADGTDGDSASNSWSFVDVTYAELKSALAAHESSSYAVAAVNSLPSRNPATGNAEWSLPEAYARMLGLSMGTPSVDDTVTLNTSYDWSYGQDVVNAIEHELSEGAMGRVGGLGDQNGAWSTMDLFRYSAPNVRDYSDGRDGATTFFSSNGSQLSSLSFNNEYDSSGQQVNGGDTADFVQRDVFGTGSPGETDNLSQTDIEMMDVLGWDPMVTPSAPSTPPGTSADMIWVDQSNGDYEFYDIGGNAVLACYSLGQIGMEWQVAGLGDFEGSDTSDMMLRDSNTGQFEVYDISNSQITSHVSLGQVGLEWSVAGFGDFASRAGETDMLMRNSNTGQFEVYDISNNQVTSAAGMGQVGSEWTVAGFGDFSTRAGENDMLMRDSRTGQFEVYDISNNMVTSAGPMSQVGLGWTIAGFGDFSGHANETDMLMRDSSTGQFEVYDISNNRITSQNSMGQVGLEWLVVGFGDFSGNANETDMLMQDGNNGAFEVYDISNNQVVGYESMGQVGAEWKFGGVASSSVASTSQLAQALASYSAGSSSTSVGAAPGPDNQSAQQSQLLTPSHSV